MRLIALDFETYPITPSDAQPKPIGLAIQYEGEDAEYLAWGHESKNNATWEDGVQALHRAFYLAATEPDVQLVFHNGKFDLGVAYRWYDLPALHWSDVHDTMFMAYLLDPYAKRIGLKQLAEEYIGMPPEEKDAVAEWVWEHRRQIGETYGLKVSGAKGKASKSYLYFWICPGDLLGEYAKGDVIRTLRLATRFIGELREEGLMQPYNRERQLLPILLENEIQGLRVDKARLEREIDIYAEHMELTETWLRKRLNASGLSFDADADVASVFEREGIIKEEEWVQTKSGQLSVSKDNLPPWKFTDQQVASAFGYRNRLQTCLGTFMRPWLAQANERQGRIHTNWNQVSGESGGTKTGRPSTYAPNLLNLSKNFEGRSDGYEHPSFLAVDPLPLVRRYILPEEGHVVLHRDFSGQELRVFASNACGGLKEAYTNDPHTDPHSWVKGQIQDVVGKELERTRVKNVNFARLYGGGKGAIFKQAYCKTMEEAGELAAVHDKGLPERKVLVEEMTRILRRGEKIRTWGGRLFGMPPPNKHSHQPLYLIINYHTQGSAADITKQAVIDWYNHPERRADSRFLVTVYDEINISAHEGSWKTEMQILKDVMEQKWLDIDMLTDGKYGSNWGEMENCE